MFNENIAFDVLLEGIKELSFSIEQITMMKEVIEKKLLESIVPSEPDFFEGKAKCPKCLSEYQEGENICRYCI